MEILKSLLCETSAAMIVCYVLDAVLIVAAIALFVWYYAKNSRKGSAKNNAPKTDVEKINEDTYVISGEAEETVEPEIVQKDNAVEHFSNQLAGINEPVSTELKSTAVIVNHEVEAHIKKPVKKEEISNYVMIDGIKKQKTDHEKEKSFNRGTDAFKNATNFLNTIKEISNDETDNTPADVKKTTARKTTSKK